MELENLRQLWRTIDLRPAREEEKDRIVALLGKRSRGPVARMRRNLLGELILVIITYVPVILYTIFGFGGRLSGIAWPLLFLMALFAGYYYQKDKLLKQMLCVSCQVRDNLELRVGSLQKYVRVYTVLGTIMVPAMAILSLILVYRNAPLAPGWKSLLPWAIALAPLTAGSYYVNSWHVRRVYGRYIRKLQDLLQEMDEA